ncbi:MAG: Wzz/FepE/Etk N-terminal domain-containing protein [Duncaniella sp.]|nr:Wzz/FepE/Etk N-terminal domain-containing protein [Muribaculum sp.]MCM1255480.1 Wzz/FepE/Etk N-terminal domain-containing protein [Duncaniella sp.]
MTEEKDYIDYPRDDEQEIDLLELARKLWAERRWVLKAALLGALIGLIVAFSIPKEYTTTIKLAPEFTDNKQASGGLGALASMAGLTSGGTGLEAVQPQLYPDIVSSVPFTTGLFDVPVTDKKGELRTTVREYLEEETSAPWWSWILGLPGKAIGGVKSIFSDDEEDEAADSVNTFRLSMKESSIVEALNNRVSADVDTKTSIITLSTTMQDPMVSALLADTVAERLKAYVTDYRTNKAREDLEYAKMLNDEAKKEYYKAQQRYADYMDKNQGVVLRSVRTEQERLQNEASLAFNLYNTTAQRLQAAKAKVQEITPVYTVVQPATVPLRPSKPSKFLILAGFIFLFVVGACAWILFGRGIRDEFRNTATLEPQESSSNPKSKE